jgi:hypothetical protein
VAAPRRRLRWVSTWVSTPPRGRAWTTVRPPAA